MLRWVSTATIFVNHVQSVTLIASLGLASPALLKALVEMEKEERERPIVWLAQYLADYSEN